jgi:hypothetical protein
MTLKMEDEALIDRVDIALIGRRHQQSGKKDRVDENDGHYVYLYCVNCLRTLWTRDEGYLEESEKTCREAKE